MLYLPKTHFWLRPCFSGLGVIVFIDRQTDKLTQNDNDVEVKTVKPHELYCWLHETNFTDFEPCIK